MFSAAATLKLTYNQQHETACKCSSPPSSNSRHSKHQTARSHSFHPQRPTSRERSPYQNRNRQQSGSASLLRRVYRRNARIGRSGTRSAESGLRDGERMRRIRTERDSGLRRLRPMLVRLLFTFFPRTGFALSFMIIARLTCSRRRQCQPREGAS